MDNHETEVLTICKEENGQRTKGSPENENYIGTFIDCVVVTSEAAYS